MNCALSYNNYLLCNLFFPSKRFFFYERNAKGGCTSEAEWTPGELVLSLRTEAFVFSPRSWLVLWLLATLRWVRNRPMQFLMIAISRCSNYSSQLTVGYLCTLCLFLIRTQHNMIRIPVEFMKVQRDLSHTNGGYVWVCEKGYKKLHIYKFQGLLKAWQCNLAL